MSSLGTKIVIDGDSTGFERAAGRAGAAMGKLGGQISGDLKSVAAGFVGYQAFKHLIGGVIEATKAIHDFAKQQNISYEAAQRLGAAGRKTGQTMEDFGSTLNKLAGSRADAAEKNDDLLASFSKFGVTMDDLQNPLMSNYDLMAKIGRAMLTMKIDPSTQSAMRDIFGRSGSTMISALKELGANMPITLMRDEDLQRIYEAERALAKFYSTYKKLAAKPIAQVVELVERMTGQVLEPDKMNALRRGAGKYIKDYPEEDAAMRSILKGFQAAELNGTESEKEEYRAKFRNRAVLRIGEEGAEKYFPKPIEEKIKDADKAAEQKEIGERLYENKRKDEQTVSHAEMSLQDAVLKSMTNRLPVEQKIVELRRQANIQAMVAAELDSEGATTADKIAAIEAKKKELALNDEIYGFQKGGQMQGLNLDAATKANLGTGGAQLYDPMLYASQNNTSAIKALTDEMKRLNSLKGNASSVDPIGL